MKTKYWFLTLALSIFLSCGMAFAQGAVAIDTSSAMDSINIEMSELQTADGTKTKKAKRSFFQRFFEVGVDIDAGVSNNYFGLGDLLQETIVLDFTEMSDNISYRGLALNGNLDFTVFSNIYAKNSAVGFDVDVNTLVNFLINKDVIRLIASGNTIDGDMLVGAGFGASSFAAFDVPVTFKPFKKLTLQVTGSYFLPVLYIPYVDATVTTRINSDGTVALNGSATANAYSALPITDFSSINVYDVLSQGGVDISVAGEFAFLSFLDLGASVVNLPLIPSKLNCQYSYLASVSYSMDDSVLNQYYTNGAVDTSGFTYSLEQQDVSTVEKVKVFRPMKFGFWANWRPLNNKLLTLTPFVQVRFLDATLANAAGCGFDYALKAATNLGMFEAAFVSSYIDMTFRQELDLKFNVRFFELDLSVASQSANFAKSLCGSGLGLGLSVIFGF